MAGQAPGLVNMGFASVAFAIMHHTVTAKIAGSVILPIVDPGRLGITAIPRDFKRAARDIGRCQEIDKVWVNCRTMWIVTVDTGIFVIKYMHAMGERFISIQASSIVTLEAEAVRNMIEVGLWVKFIALCQYAFKTRAVCPRWA